jgi:hypothetical protein
MVLGLIVLHVLWRMSQKVSRESRRGVITLLGSVDNHLDATRVAAKFQEAV